jgi:hypothetical protein
MSEPTLADLLAHMQAMQHRFDAIDMRISAMGQPIMGSQAQAPQAQPAQPPAQPIFAAISANNQVDGKRISSLYPQIEPALLDDIMTHKFKPTDLWKLDNRYRLRRERMAITFDHDQLVIKSDRETALKDFPSFHTFLAPLSVYLSILVSFAATSKDAGTVHWVAWATSQFTHSLTLLSQDFEWPAVLTYAIEFMTHRRTEMAADHDYSGWARQDHQLSLQYLMAYPKKRDLGVKPNRDKPGNSGGSAVCRNFNAGGCPSPCQWHRIHKCAKCNSAQHGANACTAAQ